MEYKNLLGMRIHRISSEWFQTGQRCGNDSETTSSVESEVSPNHAALRDVLEDTPYLS
jgi:hypothetical protein